MTELRLTPIGTCYTPFAERVEAPCQPAAARGVPGRIELDPGRGFEDALADLEGWDRIWVLFWFDRNGGWRPTVLPPRSTTKRGVFATRSPYRPNPLGMSVLRLERVDGLTLHVRDVDLLDETPVLDIKPYVPWTDAVPEAGSGWLTQPDPVPAWTVRFAPTAEEQLQFLAAHGVELRPRIVATLSLGPHPHAYRRIKVVGDRRRLAVRDWRAWFRLDDSAARVVMVDRIASGYRPRELLRLEDPDLGLHRAVVARWG